MADPFPPWLEGLEARHRQSLTFAEIRKGLQALSSLYVERREKLDRGAALDGAGKRAAFALYYAPLHFLLLREMVRGLGAAAAPPRAILDLGCGTGAAGLAWALECGPRTAVRGVDHHRWALGEARDNARALGLTARFEAGDLAKVAWPPPEGLAVVLAFAVNEVAEEARATLLRRLVESVRGGARVLVVEPLARGIAPWWGSWHQALAEVGGRADEWRFRVDLPPTLKLLDKAAGLDHRELRGRSLYAAG